MEILFPKKERTPLGFCDGLDKIFVGFGNKDERGCQPPKYHASYAPYYPIHKAASMGDIDTVKSFVERGAFSMEQIDWKYRTALHFACVYGHPEVVTFLVESSCEISPKDIKDATPLIKAAQCRQTECLDILLKHGADPNIMDCRDNTALHYAVYNGDVETAAKLLEYKANIEAINENKITPLLLALKQNKEKMAEFLINNGANAKTCDFLGRSTLMYAVRCGSELIIKLLLQRDIDTFKQDAFGWTAKRYAVESKSKVRKLLIDYDEEELRQTSSDKTSLSAVEDSTEDSESIFECLAKKGSDHFHEPANQSGYRHIKESPKKHPLFKPITEVKDLYPKHALEMEDVRTLASDVSIVTLKTVRIVTVNSPVVLHNIKFMPECLLQKRDVSHLPKTAAQRRINDTCGEMKGPPKEYTPQFKPTIQRESSFEYTAIVSMHESTREPEEPGNEVAPTEERKGHEDHQSVQSWTISETFSQEDDVVHLARTTDRRAEDITNVGMQASNKTVASTEEPRRSEKNEKVLSLIVSASLSTKEDQGHLAKTVDQREEDNTSLEMNGPCKAVTSTEDERKCDSGESIQSLILHEPHAEKKNIVHFPRIADPRGEEVANGQKKAELNLYVASREEQKKDDINSNSQPLLKQKKKTGLSNRTDTVEKPSYGNTASAPAATTDDDDDDDDDGDDGDDDYYDDDGDDNDDDDDDDGNDGDDGDGDAAATAASPKDEEDDAAATAASPKDEEDDDAAAAATSNNGIRHEFIIQRHFGKAGNHQFPVTTKKHVGLNEKICDEKNKAVEHLDAIDDHQLSQSASEDDILPDYDNILMIVDQLQMNYKDSGRLLEIQDAVHSYKMILEHKQSHSELLTEKSKKMKIGASEMLKKPRETEKAKSQLRCKNEEQQLELIGVGLAGKQEEQQRNAHYLHEEIKKQLTEKEEQHKKEKQQLEMCLKAQDTELRHLRNHMKKMQTGQEFVNNFREMYTTSVMRQLEFRIQSLESKISEMKMETYNDVLALENCNELHQSHKLRETEDQLKEVMTQFRMVTQHNMSLLNVLASECPCVANFHKCLGNLFTQENMVTPNMLTPTSRPQSSKQYRTANLDVRTAEDEETVDSTLENHDASFISLQESRFTNLQSEHSEKTTHQGSYKAESKKCKDPYLERVKMTKRSSRKQLRSKDRQEEAMRKIFKKMEPYSSAPNMSTTSPAPGFAVELLNNGWEHSSFVGREPLIQSSRPQPFAESLASFLNREREENQQTFDDRRGKHKASYMRPQEPKITNLKPKHPEELAHQTSHKAEPNQYEELYLEMIEMTKSLSHEQLKSKDRQDEAMRKNFEKTELYRSAPNTYMTSPVQGVAAGHPHSSQEHGGNFIQGEPFVTGSSPWHFVESLDNYLCRVSYAIHFDYGFRHLL
ncbi:Ankyrin repeat-containing domain containing protein [Cricetulus griseus]|nr:Ankyrin repeat-containing domain containing protein [Cricetulus griseus]